MNRSRPSYNHNYKVKEEAMQDLLNQFKALTDDQKLNFMKEAMPLMAEIFQKDPQKMMAEMMPFCMNMMRSKGMDMQSMMKMMGRMGGMGANKE
jgi:hypothetical protein